MKDLTKTLVVGDIVTTIQSGWTTITEIDVSVHKPFKTTEGIKYTKLGKLNISDVVPSLFITDTPILDFGIAIEKPIKVKNKRNVLKVLLATGYLPNDQGDWVKPNFKQFSLSMFQYCGQIPPTFHKWRSQWLHRK